MNQSEQSKHINLLQIDMDYRLLNRQKLELEKKNELTESEKLLLDNINKKMQEMRGDITINDE
jgi:hypothetical protein